MSLILKKGSDENATFSVVGSNGSFLPRGKRKQVRASEPVNKILFRPKKLKQLFSYLTHSLELLSTLSFMSYVDVFASLSKLRL